MKFILVFFLTALCLSNYVAAQSSQTETFKVWGNCGMCKKTIEKACKTKGVSKADWNQETQIMTVSFDNKMISLEQIQKKIAKVGYDNDKYKADDKAYSKLHSCCQYERKK